MLLVLLVALSAAIIICFFLKIENVKALNMLVSVNNKNELEISSLDIEYFKPQNTISFYIDNHLYKVTVEAVKPANEYGKALVTLKGFDIKLFPGSTINVKVLMSLKTP